MASNGPPKLRVMVDANVLFAGSVWPRFPHEVLQHAVAGDYQLVLSSRIIDEATTALAEVAPAAVKYLSRVLEAIQYEEVPPPTNEEITANSGLIRDPKDVHVALAAIKAGVDFLVTQDRDFTDRDETTKELHRRIDILLPGTFLREHMGWTSEELEAIRHRAWQEMA